LEALHLSTIRLFMLGPTMVLSGNIIEPGPDDKASKLQGVRALDSKLPPVEPTSQSKSAVAAAAALMAGGFTEQAGATLRGSRPLRRTYIVRSNAQEGSEIVASIRTDSYDHAKYLSTPGGKTGFLLTEISREAESRERSTRYFREAFRTTDQGKTWSHAEDVLIDEKTVFLSDENAIPISDNPIEEKTEVFVSRDQARSWETIDLAQALWRGVDAHFEFAQLHVVPVDENRAVGWMSVWASSGDRAPSLHTKRFELVFSPDRIELRGVTSLSKEHFRLPAVEEWVTVQAAPSEVYLVVKRGVRHLDTATMTWGRPVSPPDVMGRRSYVSQAWMNDESWVVRTHSGTILNSLYCALPLDVFQRACVDEPQVNYFVTHDRGVTWKLFSLDRDSEIVGLGYSNLLMVADRDDAFSPVVAGYQLPR